MFLSTIHRLKDGDGDYAVLIDYGMEGISILSQNDDLESAMRTRDECDYGCQMAVIKICRIESPQEI